MLAAGQGGIGGVGLGQRALGGHGDEGVQAGVQRLDRAQEREGQLPRRKAAGAQARAGLGQGEVGQHHSTTFGTA